mmetsp:Transcript_2789/g.7072  ORF Transcript_2789/g.7072 Transcript_2789/m.7072 type:complete len:759 (-) Transcript_2789:75-2351(-)
MPGEGRAAIAHSSSPKRYPLEENPWLRLGIIFLCCAICTGVMPGAALFVQLFVDAGVGGSACGNGEGPACDEQYSFVSEAFTSAASIGLIATAAGGFLFDKYGGNFVAKAGVVIVIVGFVLLQVPLLGARYGNDGQTASFLPVAICALDFGCLINNYAAFAMTWHLPKYQTLIATVSQSASSLTAFLPLLMQMVIGQTGLPLHVLFQMWLVLTVIACVATSRYVPTQEEFRAQAEKALGFPPPRGDRISVWRLFVDANATIGVHLRRHLVFVFTLAACFSVIVTYTSLAADYARLVFKSTELSHYLSGLSTLASGVVGTIVPPILIYAGDRGGVGIFGVVAIIVLSYLVFTALLSVPTLLAQEATCMAAALLKNVYPILAARYCMAYAMPQRVGGLIGVLNIYIILGSMPLMMVTYFWISSTPSTSMEHLSTPLFWMSLSTLVVLSGWTANFFFVGLPETPTLLPKDEEEMSIAFGCASFDEVASVTCLSGRGEVLRKLASTGFNGFKDLVQRVDLSRLEGATPKTTPAASSQALHSKDSSRVQLNADTSIAASSTVTPVDAECGSREVAGLGDEAVATTEATKRRGAPTAEWENAYVPREEVTLSAISRHSSDDVGEVTSRRVVWSGSPFAVLFGCCTADPRVPDAQVPLLQERAVLEGARPQQNARVLNEKFMDMLRSRDKQGVLSMYLTEDPQLLYNAHLDLYEMFDSFTLDQIEEEFDELIPEDDFMKLPLQRPELRATLAKIAAHKLKKTAFR